MNHSATNREGQNILTFQFHATLRSTCEKNYKQQRSKSHTYSGWVTSIMRNLITNLNNLRKFCEIYLKIIFNDLLEHTPYNKELENERFQLVYYILSGVEHTLVELKYNRFLIL